jgi:hypothetical protein
MHTNQTILLRPPLSHACRPEDERGYVKMNKRADTLHKQMLSGKGEKIDEIIP